MASLRSDRGQTLGIYIVAISALFFLAFAYFAVGQASVRRNETQTAADAAALAAARADRDAVRNDLLDAMKAGDPAKLTGLLTDLGDHDAAACSAAADYASRNGAKIPDGGCVRVDGQFGYTVSVQSIHSVGKSVVDGTETMYANATATAVVSPRCTFGGKKGQVLGFTCDNENVTIDPTSNGLQLDLATFYSVHLIR